MSHPVDNLVRLHCGAPVEVRAAAKSEDGTMFGHFAVFDTWTEINSWFEGNFLERIAPGAFAKAFKAPERVKVLYEHGHDPTVGNKLLGVPQVMREDTVGAYFEVDLFDASYVNDLRPALRSGQLGSSFRFAVTGEEIVKPTKPTPHNPQRLDERTITSVDLYEFGPCPFPAYADATAGLRSTTDEFIERLMRDPQFLARFSKRAGLLNTAEILTNAAGAAPANTTDAGAAPAVASGRLVASARTSIATLRKATK